MVETSALMGQTESLSDQIDPLELHKLSLDFDYLMFKIKDTVANLSDATYESILQKQQFIDIHYLEEQLHLKQELEVTDKLIDRCVQLENEFFKLDQLYDFVADFKVRLNDLEKELKRI